MFEGLEPPVVERICALAKQMKTLSDKDLKVFSEALADQRWTHKGLTPRSPRSMRLLLCAANIFPRMFTGFGKCGFFKCSQEGYRDMLRTP